MAPELAPSAEGPAPRLENPTGDLRVDSLLVVDSLRVPFGTVSVNYHHPSVLLPGLGPPVLIR